jgi:hypothetical protein
MDRAQEHFRVLKASIDAFLVGGDHYSIAKEFDAKAGVWRFRLKLHREPPITDWSLLIGDCIHNLRSALDHFFWALILIKHQDGKIRKESTAIFPILKDPTTFKGQKADLEDWVGTAALAKLESMQPYQHPGTEDNGLLFIHEGDIADKHKLLLPTFQLLNSGGHSAQTSPNWTTAKSHFVLMLGPFEDGAVMAEVSFVPPDAIVDVNFNPTLGVAFKPDARIFVLDTLAILRNRVQGMEAEFLPLLVGAGHEPPQQ